MATDPFAADYFDGLHARPRPVRLRVADGCLHIEGDGVQAAHALAGLRWPERTRHGARWLHLPDGASLHSADGAGWDRWSAAAAGRRDPWVVSLQQRWRWVAASVLAMVALCVAGYRWGLPWAATVAVAHLPAGIDDAVGQAALAAARQRQWLGPTRLPAAQRQAVRAAFAEAVARLPAGTVPPWRLEFQASRMGPNAFALPGGTIVVTDALVTAVHGDRAILLGVLGHELGHVQHRDGMRLLVQGAVLAGATSALFGDLSQLLALLPTWLGQASYSRDAERAADAASVTLMRANGISPAVMVDFFRIVREAARRSGADTGFRPPIAIASHPADAERIAFFEQAARRTGDAR